MICKKGLCVLVGALMLLLVSQVAKADSFTEFGDAGSLIGTANITQANGPLTSIFGTLALNDVDIYQIILTGGGTFSATTVGGGITFDSQLFLFNSSGIGVYHNDDVGAFSSPSTLPAGNALTPLAPGVYYLAITAWNIDAVSLGGLIFPDQTSINQISGPTGPGGGLPLSGWTGSAQQSGSTLGGPYTIYLTGANPVVTPEPTTFVLFATGAGVMGWLRRRRTSTSK